MSDLPAPLTAPDCDLRGYDFMPLFGTKLFGSEFYARSSDAAFRAGIKLWWTAWQQCQAGSLPDDDVALCRFADLGRDMKSWAAIRENALHGFIKCSDGRLYHPMLCEEAAARWAAKSAASRKYNRRLEIMSDEWAAMRASVFARDDYTCRYCGVRGAKLECDHVLPVSAGGRTSRDNLVTACFKCNREKGSKLDWMAA